MTEDFFTEDIGFEPSVNYDDKSNIKLNMKNGSPELINEIEAIKKWILKFAITEQGTYPIYEGTGFGTRFKKLFGQKRISYGVKVAELERDYREGLPLCPAISEVTDFKVTKKGKTLNIYVQVKLKNGDLVDANINDTYEIGEI